MNVKKSKLTNRENRIHFLYKHFLIEQNNDFSQHDLYEKSSLFYNFSEIEEKTINYLIFNIKDIECLLIEKLPLDWKINRINKIDKAVLVNGIFEIKYLKNKKAIVINESLNYLEKFSSKESKNITNAILDKF